MRTAQRSSINSHIFLTLLYIYYMKKKCEDLLFILYDFSATLWSQTVLHSWALTAIDLKIQENL